MSATYTELAIRLREDCDTALNAVDEAAAMLESQALEIQRLWAAIYKAQIDVWNAERGAVCTDLCNALGHANNCRRMENLANSCTCKGPSDNWTDYGVLEVSR